ncbi:progonadoliberin-2 [Carlito syrichta]|uniref:Progonadoliberin-2 n=1 Tax=Carlito syrichta TaxID=1868482 RepID=A0A1U7SKY2_CARSF|nr:progonadoliberin-2 [Carlito syrichta]
MASSRLGLLLLLLLLTAHPGPSKAQHWSHGWYPGGKRASSSSQDPQSVLRSPGRDLDTAAGSPAQTAHSLPSDALDPPEDSAPWKGRTIAKWSLRRMQHLAQTLLVSGVRGPQHSRPATGHQWPLWLRIGARGAWKMRYHWDAPSTAPPAVSLCPCTQQVAIR